MSFVACYRVMWGLLQSPVGSSTQPGYLCYALHRVPATASCGALYIGWVSLLCPSEGPDTSPSGGCYSVLWCLLHSLGISAMPFILSCYSACGVCYSVLWCPLYSLGISAVSFIGACYSALWWLLQRPVVPATQPRYLCYACHNGLLQLPVGPATLPGYLSYTLLRVLKQLPVVFDT